MDTECNDGDLPVTKAVGVGVGLGLFLVAGLVVIVMLGVLRPHRTDIPPGAVFTEGKSPVWQFNVLAPSNYNRTGRRLLILMYTAHFAAFVGAVVFIISVLQ